MCQQTQADGGVYTMYYVTTDIATTPASLQLLNEAAAGGPISQAACSTTGSMNPVVATVLVDPRGKPTTYERDANTNLVLSVTDPLTQVTSYTYDANTVGQIVRASDRGADDRFDQPDASASFRRYSPGLIPT